MFALLVYLFLFVVALTIVAGLINGFLLWCKSRVDMQRLATDEEPVMPAHACYGRLCPVCKGWREAAQA